MKQSLLVLTTVSALALGGCGGETKEEQPTPNEAQAPVAAASLCNAQEKVLFTCMIASEGKMLSVCGSSDLSASTGYLQYRYGTASAVDMMYPSSTNGTQGLFKLNANALSFQNGSITYQVGSAGVKTMWAKAPERNKSLNCVGAAVNNLSSLNGIVQ